jgi:hypothetical protein
VIYNFFSAPGLAVNLKTENATFPLVRRLDGRPPLIVHGTFVTEVHVVAVVGGAKRKFANCSYWASRLDENNWGWDLVTGSCGGHRFKLGKGGQKTCEGFVAKVDMARVAFSVGNVTIAVRGSPTHAMSGPEHRLDVGFTVRGDYVARNLPHGIFGRSFSSPEPRHGKVDRYPLHGEFTTSAMAEGALEGTASLYEVVGPYDTDFYFSRFSAAQLPAPLPGGPTMPDASASAVEYDALPLEPTPFSEEAGGGGWPT